MQTAAKEAEREVKSNSDEITRFKRLIDGVRQRLARDPKCVFDSYAQDAWGTHCPGEGLFAGSIRNNRAQLEAELAELQATVARLEQERQEVCTRALNSCTDAAYEEHAHRCGAFCVPPHAERPSATGQDAGTGPRS